MSTEYIERGLVFRAMADSVSEGDAVAKINAIPAAAVEPVVHARWDKHNGKLRCSKCGTKIPQNDASDTIFAGYVKRCYSCGAHMSLSGSESLHMDERSEHED